MPIGGVYDTGTVAVTNGSTAVVGTGVFWSDVLEGDHLLIGGLISLIASVDTGASTLTLMKPYAGATNATAAYQLVKMSWLRYDPATVMYQVRDMLSRIKDSNTGLFYYTVGTPDPAIGENGDLAIDVSASLWTFWKKASGIWVLQSPLIGPAVTTREFLSANTNFFVRTDGSDSADGRIDTTGPTGAFATWQGAFNSVSRRFDFRGYTATLKKGAGGSGTFTAGVTIGAWVGGGQITIDGGASTGCTINSTVTCIETAVGVEGPVNVTRIKLVSGAYGVHSPAGTINIGTDVDFGACQSHIIARNPGSVINVLAAAIKNSGGAFGHISADAGAVIHYDNNAVTNVGTPVFSAYAVVTGGGQIFSQGCTFSGAVTGNRYLGLTGGNIWVGGAGDTYFPGSAVGGANAAQFSKYE